ncbi:uncharacterized protein [Spinacia oleracea]|uniref:Lipoxygenase domain-containing protein n=1 Tax=Spinacia oleracea TaxID=3562 RepID=A0A9R0JHE8_SPIOL|nr:uncharacterized protein LOC110774984 [Spinacia oleracea]
MAIIDEENYNPLFPATPSDIVHSLQSEIEFYTNELNETNAQIAAFRALFVQPLLGGLSTDPGAVDPASVYPAGVDPVADPGCHVLTISKPYACCSLASQFRRITSQDTSPL